jgi:hypothetical protein
MPNANDIGWFKQSFGAAIAQAVADTPFDADQIVAIACQETGYIWSRLRRTTLSLSQITALCVGDTIDFKAPDKGRQAFPRNKAALIAEPGGAVMFDIARDALVNMAVHIDDYAPAASNPDKFCRGFGIFQRDLQFFKTDPAYFLQRRYESIDETLQHCLGELRRGLVALDFQDVTRLTDADFCKVAIAYNTGRYRPSKGLKQGHFDGVKFYGEYIADYVALSRTVGAVATHVVVQAGLHDVMARGGLKLRAGPGTTFDWERILPLGLQLRVVRVDAGDAAWALVDLEGDGLVDGYVFAAFLAPSQGGHAEGVAEPD